MLKEPTAKADYLTDDKKPVALNPDDPYALRGVAEPTGKDAKYIARVLGPALAMGLTEVTCLKPRDPILHLSLYLRRYGENVTRRRRVCVPHSRTVRPTRFAFGLSRSRDKNNRAGTIGHLNRVQPGNPAICSIWMHAHLPDLNRIQWQT